MSVGLAVIVASGQAILNIIKNHLTNTVIIVNISKIKNPDLIYYQVGIF